ncbi:MAG TPA: glycosyltransferase family 2 protein [Pyrinomonadaceae bacterium]
MTTAPDNFACTVLVPIRRVRFQPEEARTLGNYFKSLLGTGCEVLVVDGSPAEVFAEHDRVWGDFTRHVKPDPKFTFLNGKVNGVHTGVELASSEYIIVADDDIRYTASNVKRMCSLLSEYEVVRPQNFISPTPFWARLENARILVNRGVLRTGDYPGTCGFRRSTMLRVGPYDGDVLFDNEEMIRHFAVQGATIKYALDFFILKRPPTFKKWVEQRPRQAYEDFVMRLKTMAFMSVLPLASALLVFRGLWSAVAFAAIVSVLALVLCSMGLVRTSAFRVFSTSTPLFAPLWILERSVSVYWAIYWRVRYGGYPFGDKLLSKGTGSAWIRGATLQRRNLRYIWTNPGVRND